MRLNTACAGSVHAPGRRSRPAAMLAQHRSCAPARRGRRCRNGRQLELIAAGDHFGRTGDENGSSSWFGFMPFSPGAHPGRQRPGIGFRQCVLHERAVLLRFGLGADLGPYPFHLGRTVPGQLGGLVDASRDLRSATTLRFWISTAALVPPGLAGQLNALALAFAPCPGSRRGPSARPGEKA